MAKHKFAHTKSLNTKLHNAELNTIDVLLAVGHEPFSTTFANLPKVAFRFGATSAPYQLTEVRGGVLVEFAVELTSTPHLFFTTAARALVDVEYHLSDPEDNKLSKSFGKVKQEMLEALGQTEGWTYNAENQNVFLKKGTDAEARAKDFLKASEAFRIDGRIIERLSLKQIDKMAAEDDKDVQKLRARTEKAKAEKGDKAAKKEEQQASPVDDFKKAITRMTDEEIMEAMLTSLSPEKAAKIAEAIMEQVGATA